MVRIGLRQVGVAVLVHRSHEHEGILRSLPWALDTVLCLSHPLPCSLPPGVLSKEADEA